MYSKWRREISLEYLSEEKYVPFSTTDEYLAQPPSGEEYPLAEKLTDMGQIKSSGSMQMHLHTA